MKIIKVITEAGLFNVSRLYFDVDLESYAELDQTKRLVGVDAITGETVVLVDRFVDIEGDAEKSIMAYLGYKLIRDEDVVLDLGNFDNLCSVLDTFPCVGLRKPDYCWGVQVCVPVWVTDRAGHIYTAKISRAAIHDFDFARSYILRQNGVLAPSLIREFEVATYGGTSPQGEPCLMISSNPDSLDEGMHNALLRVQYECLRTQKIAPREVPFSQYLAQGERMKIVQCERLSQY
ncbi:MAG: hypothetical protein ACM3ZQ_11760 [Bacillota bacterium]